MPETTDEAAPPPPRRARRWTLYAPYILLALLATGWSVGWLVLRGQSVAALDRWVAEEARRGQTWTCADRTLGGFPFRMELRCGALTLARPDLTIAFGRTLVVSQIYRPAHLIAEASGPLTVRGADLSLDSTWDLLQASVVLGRAGLERFALVASAPTLAGTAGGRAIDLKARSLELHVRPDPETVDAADVAVSARGAAIPGADALVGGPEGVEIDLVTTLTQAGLLPAKALAAEIERWREAGGRIEVTRLALAKGARRLEGRGTLALDEAHRPAGAFDLAAAGLEEVVGRLAGDRSGLAGGLVTALLTGGRRADAASGLKPLPPVRLERGRILFGALAVPGLRLDPLY